MTEESFITIQNCRATTA